MLNIFTPLLILFATPVQAIVRQGNWKPMEEILSEIKGIYSHYVDSSLCLNVGYDLSNCSKLPMSAISSLSVRKVFDFETQPESCGSLSLGGTVLFPDLKLILRTGVATEGREVDLEINDAAKRLQLRFGRRFLHNKFMLVLSPNFLYGSMRSQVINWTSWLPNRRSSTFAGLPGISFEQGNLRADWSDSASSLFSSLNNIAFKLSFRAGNGGQIVSQLLDARYSKRLWTYTAILPLSETASPKFIAERQYQIAT